MKPRDSLGLREGYHSPQLDVEVRLNTNESPFPPPREFTSAFESYLRKLTLNRYPDRSYKEVRAAIAEVYDTEPERVFCGNGSNEVLLNIALAYGGPNRRAVVFEPTYSLHSHIASTVGTEVVTLGRDSSFQINDALVQQAEDISPEMVYLCSPNNPTGALEDADIVKKIFALSSDPLVMLDEAYADFLGQKANLGSEPETLIRLRTFSKWFDLAGLRFGFCIASKEVVSVLDQVVLPYHLDQIKQVAVLAALRTRQHFEDKANAICKLRDDLYDSLVSLGVRAHPSNANFILVEFPEKDPKMIWRQLVERSILVRDTTSWPMLPPSLRITVGTALENERLLVALQEILR
jgi:histidinol-phosphate aminotransferase